MGWKWLWYFIRILCLWCFASRWVRIKYLSSFPLVLPFGPGFDFVIGVSTWVFIFVVVAAAMPPRPFEDGPICENPKAVAILWEKDPVLRERANQLQKLVQSKDPKEKAIKINRDNLIFNAPVLEAYARDLSSRDRSTADPVEVIYEMVAEWYAKHPLYPQFCKDYDAKGWAYHAAWPIHKMVSYLRNIVPKHKSIRDLCLNYLKLHAPKFAELKAIYGFILCCSGGLVLNLFKFGINFWFNY